MTECVPRLDWSADQEQALDAIGQWKRWWRPGEPPFALAGHAGSGKSEIVAHLAQEWTNAAVMCVCGKAAAVLRSKGVNAQTVHSMIYRPYEDIEGKTRFARGGRHLPYEAIIVDEASCVSDWIHQDLLNFGLPILYVGDHGQLEPIGKNPRLMQNPTAKLEQIHRQAKDNPILRLAAAFREGRNVPYWSDPGGRLRIVPKGEFQELIGSGAQLICGYNRTRHQVNARVRYLKDFGGPVPQAGERVIFLQNNKQWQVFNGQQATVIETEKPRQGRVEVTLELEDGRTVDLPLLVEQFGKDAIKEHKDRGVCLADFAYALTAHKIQGSEMPSVVVLEEIASAWDAKRWRYTCATRARNQLVYCA